MYGIISASYECFQIFTQFGNPPRTMSKLGIFLLVAIFIIVSIAIHSIFIINKWVINKMYFFSGQTQFR